jgi:hypothetical protein
MVYDVLDIPSVKVKNGVRATLISDKERDVLLSEGGGRATHVYTHAATAERK